MREIFETRFFEIILIITTLLLASGVLNLSFIRRLNSLAREKTLTHSAHLLRNSTDALEVGIYEVTLSEDVVTKNVKSTMPSFGHFRLIVVDKETNVKEHEDPFDYRIDHYAISLVKQAFKNGIYATSIRTPDGKLRPGMDTTEDTVLIDLISRDPLIEGGVCFPLGYSKDRLKLYTMWAVTSLGGKHSNLIESNELLKSRCIRIANLATEKLVDLERYVEPYNKES